MSDGVAQDGRAPKSPAATARGVWSRHPLLPISPLLRADAHLWFSAYSWPGSPPGVTWDGGILRTIPAHKKSELLAQPDPTTYKAQLDQAEANLTRDEAHLGNRRIDLGRYVPTAQQGAAPQELAATQKANVAQEEAEVKSDQAAITYAKAQLSYPKLVSPFDGVAGIRLLDVGNIIHASTSRG